MKTLKTIENYTNENVSDLFEVFTLEFFEKLASRNASILSRMLSSLMDIGILVEVAHQPLFLWKNRLSE